METKITANKIKAALLAFHRFSKGEACCTECSYDLGIADVLVLTKAKEVVEIEIKISKYDLWKELESKARKHSFLKEGSLPHKFSMMPNRFYFCVPSELKEEAEKLCEELNPKFGIVVFDPKKRPEDSFYMYRRSRKLHSQCHSEKAQEFILKRVCSDLTKRYVREYWNE